MKVLFFGVLAETTGQAQIDVEGITDSVELNKLMRKNYPGLQTHTYRMAVNRKLIDSDIALKKTDEVAFLPPFAGG